MRINLKKEEESRVQCGAVSLEVGRPGQFLSVISPWPPTFSAASREPSWVSCAASLALFCAAPPAVWVRRCSSADGRCAPACPGPFLCAPSSATWPVGSGTTPGSTSRARLVLAKVGYAHLSLYKSPKENAAGNSPALSLSHSSEFSHKEN